MKYINLRISVIKNKGQIDEIKYEDITPGFNTYKCTYINGIKSFHEIEMQCNSIYELITFSVTSQTKSQNLSEISNKCGVLSDSLFGDVIHELKQILFRDNKDDIRFLQLLIDDELSNIPWENTRVNDQFLWEQFHIGRTMIGASPASDSQSLSYQEYENLNMLMIANPGNDLENASIEADEIEKKISNYVELERYTSIKKNQFKEQIRNNWQIFHFAGHVAYKNNLSEIKAGLGLTDGFLFSNDIESLSKNTRLPELIFINACHSAHSQAVNIDMINLAKAFLKGNPRHFIGTFCELGDRQAKKFAVQFYTNLFIEKKTVGESLYAARQHLFLNNEVACLNYILYGVPNFKYHIQDKKLIHDSNISPTNKDGQEPVRAQTIGTDKTILSIDDEKSINKRLHIVLKFFLPPFIVLLMFVIVLFFYNKNIPKPQIERTDEIEYCNKKILPDNDSWTSKELTLAIMIDKKLKNDDQKVAYAISKYICDSYPRVKLLERMKIDILIDEFKLFQSGFIEKEARQTLSLKPVGIFVYISTTDDDSHKTVLMNMFYYNGSTFDYPVASIKPGRILLQKEYLGKQLIEKLREKYPIRGRISKIVNNGNILINIGANVGVDFQTKFQVIDKNIILKVVYIEQDSSKVIVEKGGIPLKSGWKIQALEESGERENDHEK
jgi:CHAT domain-containing protein